MSNQNQYRIDQIHLPNGSDPALFGSIYRIDSSSNNNYEYGLSENNRMHAEHPMLWGRLRNNSDYNYPSIPENHQNANVNQVENRPAAIPIEYMAIREENQESDYKSRLKESLKHCKNKSHIFLGCKLLIGHILTSYIHSESAERRIYPLMKEGTIFEIGEENEPTYLITPEGEFYYFNSITQTIERFDFDEEKEIFEYVGDIAVACGPIYSPIFYLLSHFTSTMEEKKILLLIGGKAVDGNCSQLIHVYDLKNMDPYLGPINMKIGRSRPLVFHDNKFLFILGGADCKSKNRKGEYVEISTILNSVFSEISTDIIDIQFSNFTISVNSLTNSAMFMNGQTNNWLIIRRNRRQILKVKGIDLVNKTIRIGYFKKKLNCPIDYNLSNTNILFLSPYVIVMTNEKPYIAKTKIVN